MANTNLNKTANTKSPNNKITTNTQANKSIVKSNAPSLFTNTAKATITNNTQAAINEKLTEIREKTGHYDILTENYFLLLGLSLAIVLLVIIYFFSSSFRVSRCISRMAIIQGYQTLLSLDYSAVGDMHLGNYYVESAYNPCHCGYQMFDYTSEQVLISNLQSGARYLELNIFNSEFGANAFPVVSNGYQIGEWKLMATDTPLETCFQAIAATAFTVKQGSTGVQNSEDPLFIGLNLKTNSNLATLNLIAALVTKYFNDRLLNAAYSYQNSDAIAQITMSNLTGRVVFFSSDGFQGSGLEEIINYCWDNYDNNPNHALRHYYYSDLLVSGFNATELINFNRTGLSIVVPHKEGDIVTSNYDSSVAMGMGCHFTAMNLNYIDVNMDSYITNFKNNSLVMRPDTLTGSTPQTTMTTIPFTKPIPTFTEAQQLTVNYVPT